MRRRYRRRRKNSIASVVGDVTHIASKLSWWGALLTGVSGYLFFSVFITYYSNSQITALEGNQFLPIVEIRLGRLAHVSNWVGIACLLVGLFFSIRNYFISQQAHQSEKSVVSILSKLISRYID